MPRIEVGIIQSKSGVLHSVWIDKEHAEQFLEKNKDGAISKSNGYYADKYLVRGVNEQT